MLDQIVKKIENELPSYVGGIDRHMQMSKLVQQLSREEMLAMHREFSRILLHMRKIEASDVEIGGAMARDHIWMRVYGDKRPVDELGEWSRLKTDVFCHSLLNPQQHKRLFENFAVDFSHAMDHQGNTLRWRASMYMDIGHLALNLRAINDSVFPFKKLGFHPNIARAFSLRHEKQGLVLLTGITGSGKSTTMDSIVDANNRSVDGHIVIIGDPIEYIHNSHRCIVRHREVGKDVKGFKEGAVQSLRQDPDIIVVGEMRDPETIMSCLEISDTGHKVFSTLHTGSSVETIDRIVAEIPPSEQERVRVRLADQLRVVVSQKLVPSLDGKRQLAKEVLLVNSSVRAAIRNKNTHEIYQMISEGGKNGLITLEQDLVRLVAERRISDQTAVDFANNKNRVKELLENRKN